MGIITINGLFNYGNRLQNYALQYYLEKNNVKVTTFWEYSKYSYYFKHIIRTFFKINNDRRKSNFEIFTNKYIKVKYTKRLKDNKSIDYYITGSDQVWNPNFAADDNQLLLFTKDSKKISYAASIGLNEVDFETNERFKKNISDFKSISVREDAGKIILEKATGRKDIEVLIDPTLLLTDLEWSSIAKKPKALKCKKYILLYFLGNLSDKRKKAISNFAKQNNCEIINIMDKNSVYYICGPDEFLYLEKNAFLICTDSFHSSVFGLIFNVPFVVFDRDEEGMNNMGSRIDTLLHKFRLKDRKFNGNSITTNNLNHDYTEAYKILGKERDRSKLFLMKSINN